MPFTLQLAMAALGLSLTRSRLARASTRQTKLETHRCEFALSACASLQVSWHVVTVVSSLWCPCALFPHAHRCVACRWGHTAVAEVMLLAKANGEARCKRSGNTPLIEAALGNHSETMALLLSHGANPDALNAHGDSALFAAAARGSTDAVRANPPCVVAAQ